MQWHQLNLVNEKKRRPRRNKDVKPDQAASAAIPADRGGSAAPAPASGSDSDDSSRGRRSTKRAGAGNVQLSGVVTVEGGGGRAVGECLAFLYCDDEMHLHTCMRRISALFQRQQ
jgi:hypothetical protein